MQLTLDNEFIATIKQGERARKSERVGGQSCQCKSSAAKTVECLSGSSTVLCGTHTYIISYEDNNNIIIHKQQTAVATHYLNISVLFTFSVLDTV